MATQRVLVVDDSEPMAEAIRRKLGRLYDVEVATDAAEAARKASADDFALILLDFFMPDVRGDVLLEKMRAMGVVAPVILMSGSEEAEAVALSIGAPFLAKPFELSDLAKLVESVLQA